MVERSTDRLTPELAETASRSDAEMVDAGQQPGSSGGGGMLEQSTTSHACSRESLGNQTPRTVRMERYDTNSAPILSSENATHAISVDRLGLIPNLLCNGCSACVPAGFLR